MNVLIVSGLWPPDVGGPASHAPELAEFLLERGHGVAVVTTADRGPEPRAYPVAWTSRGDPPGVRHLRGAAAVARGARTADVVYATGMLGRSAAGARAARRPLVVKLTADPAFERARRRGLVEGDLESFQRGGGGRAAALLRTARDLELRSAAHVVCPSAYLREVALGWGLAPDRVSVLPNPVPARLAAAPAEARRRLRLGDGPLVAFAGRLTAQKSLDVAVRALADVDGATLALAGEGPARSALAELAAALGLDGRVRFLGPLPRAEALELLAAADVTVLPSAWENFPHAAVESLAAGTPVIAAAVGGVAEIVRDGENGLLVPPGDARALAAALRRCLGDDALRDRLAAAAPASVAPFAPERVYRRLEEILVEAGT